METYEGKPCKLGHTARCIKNGACFSCRLQQHRARMATKSEAWRLRGNALSRAGAQGLAFDLTEEYIKSIWPKDNRCPILHTEFVRTSKKGPSPTGPSLDRIRPHLGYVMGNVAVISFRANIIKQNETDPAVFRAVADWLERISE